VSEGWLNEWMIINILQKLPKNRQNRT